MSLPLDRPAESVKSYGTTTDSSKDPNVADTSAQDPLADTVRAYTDSMMALVRDPLSYNRITINNFGDLTGSRKFSSLDPGRPSLVEPNVDRKGPDPFDASYQLGVHVFFQNELTNLLLDKYSKTITGTADPEAKKKREEMEKERNDAYDAIMDRKFDNLSEDLKKSCRPSD